ncbi:MAG: 16S rRNA (guanine(966)-N(2))-methyltransferase RsmD [Clostridiales bacterium]
MLRVISGSVKGFKLKKIKGNNTRPTSDRIKESIFNLIGYDFSGKTVLDLFSGTGSLGIEALSRGAKKAVFVDKSYESYNTIKYNLNKTWYLEVSKIIKSDVLRYLDTCLGNDIDLVFLDPPYNDIVLIKTMERLNNKNLLNDNGIVVVEKHKNHLMNETYSNLCKIKEKNYGITSINIYRKFNQCKKVLI